MVRFIIAILLGFGALFGVTMSFAYQTPIVASATPTPLPTSTPPMSVAESAAQVQERWIEYGIQAKYQKWNRTLYDFMMAHTPSNLNLKDSGIELDHYEGVWAWAIQVPSSELNEFPLVIVSFPTVSASIQGTLLFTWRSKHWEWQILPYVDLNQVKLARFVPNSSPLELFLVYEDCAFCSATGIRFDLWRWTNTSWQPLWQMPTNAHQTSHGELELNSSLDTIKRRYSSWPSPDSENFFHESNPGPHRYFTETWTRQDDAYQLVSTETEPSAYNTLVEFSYAMNQGDWDAAKRWTVADAVVQQAQALDYKNVGDLTSPPKGYTSPPHDGCSSTTIEQCALWEVRSHKAPNRDPLFDVYLIKQNGKWLISKIETRR